MGHLESLFAHDIEHHVIICIMLLLVIHDPLSILISVPPSQTTGAGTRGVLKFGTSKEFGIP